MAENEHLRPTSPADVYHAQQLCGFEPIVPCMSSPGLDYAYSLHNRNSWDYLMLIGIPKHYEEFRRLREEVKRVREAQRAANRAAKRVLPGSDHNTTDGSIVRDGLDPQESENAAGSDVAVRRKRYAQSMGGSKKKASDVKASRPDELSDRSSHRLD